MPLVKIVERTPMSALGQKQTFRGAIVMFAFPSKAVAYMRSDEEAKRERIVNINLQT
jgi:hypothetical protein